MFDSLLTLKYLSAGLVFIMTWVAALWPVIAHVRKDQSAHFLQKGQALASGVFLGAGLVRMLPDAQNGFVEAGIHFPIASVLVGGVFLLLLLLEHIAQELNEKKGKHNALFVLISLTMLSIHSLLSGSALGVATNYSTTLLIIIAILAHKWAESFSLSIQLTQSGLVVRQILISLAVFSIMTPLGVLIGNLVEKHVNTDPIIVPIFTALAAGTFFYIGTLHGLRKAVMIERCCNLKEFSYLVVGFVLMAVVANWT